MVVLDGGALDGVLAVVVALVGTTPAPPHADNPTANTTMSIECHSNFTVGTHSRTVL